MNRTDFLKALAVLPFAPAVLERLKPAPFGRPLGYAHDFMPGEDPAMRSGPTGSEDESWEVEFAGAAFTLWQAQAVADAPFECRLGVDHLANGWKRLVVVRDGKTYVAGVKRGPGSMGVTGSLDMVEGEDLTAQPDWWPRRIR